MVFGDEICIFKIFIFVLIVFLLSFSLFFSFEHKQINNKNGLFLRIEPQMMSLVYGTQQNLIGTKLQLIYDLFSFCFSTLDTRCLKCSTLGFVTI